MDWQAPVRAGRHPYQPGRGGPGRDGGRARRRRAGARGHDRAGTRRVRSVPASAACAGRDASATNARETLRGHATLIAARGEEEPDVSTPAPEQGPSGDLVAPEELIR